jgi:hypothetical protein
VWDETAQSIAAAGISENQNIFPMGMDSPNHTKSSPSGSRFVLDAAIGHRDSGGKFDTSGKSAALRIIPPTCQNQRD